ncbi:MAG TPA: ribonuclease P protein component, partial [Bradyrhizobium sp.]|nr:ribonuclease P protein component [Bradyrhizobium sp.]
TERVIRPQPGPFVPMERLRQRTDYLAVATGARQPTPAFVLQGLRRNDVGPPRFGFTVAKKVGKATERNRVRRRLKEMVRLAPAERMRAGYDYVLVGRRAALALPFDRLIAEFEGALERLHGGPRPYHRRAGG